jgi:hypothetical protein
MKAMQDLGLNLEPIHRLAHQEVNASTMHNKCELRGLNCIILVPLHTKIDDAPHLNWIVLR